MKLQITHANNIRFTSYVRGHGSTLILMLHGFPDDATGMIPLMDLFPKDTFTCVAPYLRGIGPSSSSRDRRYLLKDLGRDVLALIEALGHEHAILVGHDWGALSAYMATLLAPERVHLLVAISAPPPRTLFKNFIKHPAQLRHHATTFALQWPILGPMLLQHNNFAIVESLWQCWSPTWRFKRTRLAKVKNTLGRRGTAQAISRYYRGILLDAILDPYAWRSSAKLALGTIKRPTLILSGALDPYITPIMYDHIETSCSSSLRWIELPSCGHFPQQECTQQVASLILQCMAHTPSTL